MKAGVTWLVVGAVAVVGLAATVDALRGTPEPAVPSAQSETDDQPAADAGGLHGTLYYTAEEDCVLRGVRLPGLVEVPVPPWEDCEFSLSPDRIVAPAGTAWDRPAGLRAVSSRGSISLTYETGTSIAVPGTAPAFTRFGNLTFARDGTIHIGDPGCLINEQGSFEPCSRVAVRAREFRRALLRHASMPNNPEWLQEVMVERAVWLDADRLVVVLAADIRFVGRIEAVALVEDPRNVLLVDSGLGTDFGSLDASPRGRYFAVSTTTVPWLRIFDREGDALALPPLPDPHAIAWSPGDTWTAVATRASIHIFNAGRPGSRVRRLPIAAADLTWR